MVKKSERNWDRRREKRGERGRMSKKREVKA